MKTNTTAAQPRTKGRAFELILIASLIAVFAGSAIGALVAMARATGHAQYGWATIAVAEIIALSLIVNVVTADRPK